MLMLVLTMGIIIAFRGVENLGCPLLLLKKLVTLLNNWVGLVIHLKEDVSIAVVWVVSGHAGVNKGDILIELTHIPFRIYIIFEHKTDCWLLLGLVYKLILLLW